MDDLEEGELLDDFGAKKETAENTTRPSHGDGAGESRVRSAAEAPTHETSGSDREKEPRKKRRRRDSGGSDREESKKDGRSRGLERSSSRDSHEGSRRHRRHRSRSTGRKRSRSDSRERQERRRRKEDVRRRSRSKSVGKSRARSRSPSTLETPGDKDRRRDGGESSRHGRPRDLSRDKGTSTFGHERQHLSSRDQTFGAFRDMDSHAREIKTYSRDSRGNVDLDGRGRVEGPDRQDHGSRRSASRNFGSSSRRERSPRLEKDEKKSSVEEGMSLHLGERGNGVDDGTNLDLAESLPLDFENDEERLIEERRRRRMDILQKYARKETATPSGDGSDSKAGGNFFEGAIVARFGIDF